MEILIILFLIVLNGLFAMSEIALVSAKRSRLQQIAESQGIGSKGAKIAIKLQENPRIFLSTIQVGITSISIFSGIIGEKSLVSPIGDYLISIGISKDIAFSLASIIVITSLTFVSVIFGEIIPKSIALTLSDKIASFIALPMNGLAKLTYPFVWLFTTVSEVILKLLRINKFEQTTVTNEEIKELMGQGTEAGVFHESEKQLVANVLHMDEKRAASIMTHRGEWKYIDLSESFEEIRKKIIENRMSKILVVDGDINNIVGFVDITDILGFICSGANFDLIKYVDKPLYVPQTVTANHILEKFKSLKKEIAIIINEYGENIGTVTLKDIMSSIVGDIEISNENEDPEIIKREDGSFIVDGLISLDKLVTYFELDKLERPGEVNTLSGFIMAKADSVPSEGFSFEVVNYKYILNIEVIDMDKNCVDKVLIKITKPLPEETIENKNLNIN